MELFPNGVDWNPFANWYRGIGTVLLVLFAFLSTAAIELADDPTRLVIVSPSPTSVHNSPQPPKATKVATPPRPRNSHGNVVPTRPGTRPPTPRSSPTKTFRTASPTPQSATPTPTPSTTTTPTETPTP